MKGNKKIHRNQQWIPTCEPLKSLNQNIKINSTKKVSVKPTKLGLWSDVPIALTKQYLIIFMSNNQKISPY